MDINDLIISLGGVDRILKPAPANATIQEIEAHIIESVIMIEGNTKPTAQAVLDEKTAYEATLIAQ